MPIHPQDIYQEARAAAIAASIAHDATLPPETTRGFDCGFAWVTVKPARGEFIKYCKSNKLGHKKEYEGGGWLFWHPGEHPTQSIGTHEAGARAFAAVLVKHGLVAFAGSRLD